MLSEAQNTSAPKPFSPKKKRSTGRKLLLGTALTVAFLIASLVVIAAFFTRQITEKAIRELGKSLKTELKIAEADLSLIRNFPDASLHFSDVRLRGAGGGRLLEAAEVTMRFGFFSLFGDELKVHSVVIRDGFLNLVFDQKGQSNFDVLKETPTTKKPKKTIESSDSNFKIALENARFEGMKIIFEDQKARQKGSIHLEKADFSGAFSAKKFDLTTTADGYSEFVDLDGDRFLAAQKIGWDAVVSVNLEVKNGQKPLYFFKKTDILLGDNVLSMEGSATEEGPNRTNLSLKFSTKEGDVSILTSLLPASVSGLFRDFSSTGRYMFSGQIMGIAAPGKRPDFEFDLTLKNSKITSPRLAEPLENVSFSAHAVSSPNAADSSAGELFYLQDFKANLDGEPISMSLFAEGFDDPKIRFDGSGAIGMEAVYGLFDDEKITDGAGKIRLNSLKINGLWSRISSMSGLADAEASGQISFEEAALKINGTWAEAVRGGLRLEGDALHLDTIELKIGDSDLAFGGEFRHPLAVFFADSLNSKNVALEFESNLTSKNLNVDQLLAINAVDQKARGGTAESQAILDSLHEAKNAERERLTDFLIGTFEAKIGLLKYGKIEAKNFAGRLVFDRQNLKIIGSTDAFGGSLEMSGDAFFEEKPRLTARFLAKNLDLNAVLAQCDNFGQTVIEAKNLFGRLDGRLAVHSFWDEKGTFDLRKLRAWAELKGRDGQIKRLKMLEDFSTYIRIEDLRDVRFSELQNFFEIRDGAFSFPAMLIRSNACNMTVSGRHGFDDRIDYKIKMNAGQTMMNRIQKHDKSLEPLPEKNGLFNLFYSMCCDLETYKVERDKRGVKADFEKAEGRKAAIERVLATEFSGQ